MKSFQQQDLIQSLTDLPFYDIWICNKTVYREGFNKNISILLQYYSA